MEDLQIIALYNSRDSNAIRETDAKYGHLCYKVADATLHCKKIMKNASMIHILLYGTLVKLHKNKEIYKSAHKISVAITFNMKGFDTYPIAEICKNRAKNENYDFILFNNVE